MLVVFRGQDDYRCAMQLHDLLAVDALLADRRDGPPPGLEPGERRAAGNLRVYFTRASIQSRRSFSTMARSAGSSLKISWYSPS